MSDKALEALLAYRQADEDGIMVLASRQAIHEVAVQLAKLTEAHDIAVAGLTVVERRRDELKARLEEAERVIAEQREIIDIAYDHLAGAGYEKDGPTLSKIAPYCTPDSAPARETASHE